MGNGERGTVFSLTSSLLPASRQAGVPARLRRLDKYLAQGLVTQEEHAVQRTRILTELQLKFLSHGDCMLMARCDIISINIE